MPLFYTMSKASSVIIVIIFIGLVYLGVRGTSVSDMNTQGDQGVTTETVTQTDSSESDIMPGTNTTSNKNNIMEQDGLKITTSTQGTGPAITTGQTATVKYKGMLTDGSVFDQGTIDFALGQGRVIKGWELGILGMKVGEKRTLTIAPELGYGATGYPPVIPQNATLVFEVELIAIQ